MILVRFRAITDDCLLVTGPMVSLEIEEQLPPLEEGVLEIQHINTGQGDGAFFYIFGRHHTIDGYSSDVRNTHKNTFRFKCRSKT